MISALGVKFYNKNGEEIVPVGKTFADIYNIDMNDFSCECEIICLSDVKSPLFGSTGAAKMFAKQKGADDTMVDRLEEDGKKVVSVISSVMGDFSTYPGSGAAGGLGYAFKTFLNAEMRSGIEEILKISNVGEEITENTILITGEGKIDNQSLQGKVISGILDMVKSKNAKVIVVAGCMEELDEFDGIECIFACSKLGRDIEDIKKTCRLDLKKTVLKVYEYIKKKYL
jgi:glycerate kinase